MKIPEGLKKAKLLKLLPLFFIFHIFWLLFYFLSGAGFLANNQWIYYLKYSTINSIGFIVFCISAFWLFPKFISGRKYPFFIILSLAIISGCAFVQFKLQDWNPYSYAIISKNINQSIGDTSKKAILAAPMKQPIGAYSRSTLTMLIYLFLGIGYAYMKDWFVKDHYTRILEKEKLKAELTLLRYQLNPHFLFNTINDIYYLAIIKSDKTADAILKVSDLLRYVLNEKEEHTPLEREINYLQDFIKLQQFRFPDQKVDVQISISEKIERYMIAPLLLITFAENAFKHGEPGTIEEPVKISLKVVNKKLEYEVVNRINKTTTKDTTTGIGLNNLKRRMELLYAKKYHLNYAEENKIFIAQLKIELS